MPDATVKNLRDSWTEDERNWHKRTMQLAHHMAGLGLTPQCASGIAAFYHSTARFVGWLAQLDVVVCNDKLKTESGGESVGR